ncbi:PHB depolymerase family esterase [Paramyrothecium foliicola]|nr:PHB depolymerase family esterase [Paramyrothecium foliicola]
MGHNLRFLPLWSPSATPDGILSLDWSENLIPVDKVAQLTWAAALTQVSNFGSNPSGAKMFLYKPDKVNPKPALIVAIHHCQGTAQSFYQSTPYARYADTYGFLVIYPESPYSGTCWDVSSKATQTRDGGANSNSIANMVRYAINSLGADASKVYVMGASSGAMMTNIMVSTYPDLFQAAIAYSGVPAGCFFTNSVNGWNSDCAQGKVVKTGAQWAQIVKDMYPGYNGRRPKMQIYHGSADTTLRPQNYDETIKQWSAIFGYSSPTQTLPNTPKSPYTKRIYGPNLQGILGAGVGHGVENAGLDDLRWFGIISDGSNPPTTSTATTPPSATQPSQLAPQWGQCGGNGWSGPKACQSPFKCNFVNEWYSQCQ